MNKKDQWEVSIRKTSNGFICSYEDEMDDESFETKEFVFEEKEDDNNLENMRDVLIWIKEYFGIHWSKHNEKNLDVSINGEKE